MNKRNIFLSLVLFTLVALLVVGCQKQSAEKNEMKIADVLTEGEDKLSDNLQNGLMEEFRNIVDSDNEPYTIVEFIDKNIAKASEIESATMLTTLERVQESYIQSYTDELFSDNNQMKLLKLSGEELFFNESKIEEINNINLKELVEKIVEGKYKLINKEGAFYPIIDYESVKAYNNHISEEVRAYLDIRALESKKPSVLDGEFNITFDELGERILIMESYIQEYPVLLEHKSTLRSYSQYLKLYLEGADSSPIYDFQTKIIKDQVLSSYRNMSSLDNSIAGDAISRYIDIITANQNIIDENVLSSVPGIYSQAIANIEKNKMSMK